MNSGGPKNKVGNSDDISVKDLIDKIKAFVVYIKNKFIPILLFSIVCALFGLCYSIFRKPVFTAQCTFVLEDGTKMGAISQYSNLASLAGIDISSGGGGLFQGDNILELYRSRTMIERALLSEINIDGKKQKLIDRYINFNDLRDKWNDKDNLKNIQFNGNPDSFNRNQDSIISDIVELFNKKVLNVVKPDKKLNIIDVNVSSKDELFAKVFTNKLVETVNDFYVFTKTKKAAQNVKILQHQADSVRAVLNSSINGVASAIDAAPNANPQMLTLRVVSQKKEVDVQANTAIYGEVIKNLEISKISLRQEQPLIQIIDSPVLPLKSDRKGKIISSLIGFLLGSILGISYFIVKKAIEK